MKVSILSVLLILIGVELTSAQTFNPVLWQKKGGPVGGEIRDIEYDPVSGKTFVLAGPRRKLYISSDNGDTWTEKTSGNGSFNFFNDIEIVNNTIYLTTSFSIWSSSDAGVNWIEVNSSHNFNNANRIKRLSTGRLIVLGNSRVHFSTTNGVSWIEGTTPTTGINSGYLVNTSSDQIFIIKDQKPYRSVDLGANFTEFSTGLPVGFQAHSLAVNSTGTNVYCVTSDNIYISDGSSAWTSIKGGSITEASISSFGSADVSFLEFSADGLGMYFVDNVNHRLHAKAVGGAAGTWLQRQLAFPSATTTVSSASCKDFPTAATSTVFFGSRSGVIKTTNGATTYAESNTNIAGVDLDILLGDANGNLFMATTFNASVLRSGDAGNSWSKISPLTGSINSFNQNPSRNMLYAATNNDAYRSTNNGTNWTLVTLPGSLHVDVLLPADDDKVFALNGNDIYYSSNDAASWSATPVAITGFPAGFSIHTNMIMCASATRMLMRINNFSTSQNEIWKVIFGYTGTTITSAVASKVSNLPFAVNDINKAQAVNGNFYLYNPFSNPDQLSISTDAGATWNTQSITSANGAFVTHNGYIFVTTNSSKILISRDNGATFQETSLNSAVSSINDIEDIAIDFDGKAFLGFDGDFIHSSTKNIVLPDGEPSALTEVGKSATAVAIRWDDNSNNENGFEIFQSTNGTDFVKSGEADDGCNTPNARDFFVATGLQPNTAYTFRIRAENDAGTTAFAQINVTTPNSCPQTIPDNRSWSAVNTNQSGLPVIGAPVIVNIRHVSGGRYSISDASLGTLAGSPFNSSDDPASFYESCGQTFLSDSDDGDIKPDGAGTWNGTNLLTLKWRACAGDEFELINFTLSATGDPAPPVPANVNAYNLTGTSIEVNWFSGSYDHTYIIERSTNPVSGFVQVGSVPYPTTRFIDSSPDLVAGTTYHYRVRARNADTPTPDQSAFTPNASVVFAAPKFVVSNTNVTNYLSATIGSYWADFNNDGREDYLTLSFDPVTEKGSPVIFQNNGSENFVLFNSTGIDQEAYFTASVADYDNDGNTDIALTGNEDQLLDVYRGNGDFTFTKITAALGDLNTAISENIRIDAISWGDIDNDGLLDIVVVGGIPNSSNGGILLYRQNVNHTFTKISGGELATDNENSQGVAWADYNNDGHQDLLIVNQDGPFRLYENNGDNSFTKKTGNGLNAQDGLCASWGDYDNDGDMDLFAATDPLNTLYKNNGDGTFTLENPTSMSEANTAVTAAWADFNNDGFLDLVSAGFVGAQTRLFLRDASNPSTLTFAKFINEKINDISISHYGGAFSDYNQDGYNDISLSSFLFNEDGDGVSVTNTGLFKNNINTGNWSEIKLVPTAGNKSGVGAKVKLTAGGITQMREIQMATSFVAKSSNIVHFGIGSATSISNIQVIWANGDVQNYPNPPGNQILTINQDNTPPSATTLSPVNTATGVTANTAISITLDQPSVGVAGKFLLIYLHSNLSTPVTGVNLANAVKSGETYTFTLPEKLLAGTQYNISVDAGAFTDIYGNASAEFPTGLWTFTTAPAPIATALSPTHNATVVATNASLQINFDKVVSAVAGKKIKVMDGAATIADLDVSTNGAIVSTTTSTYTLTPATAWPNTKLLKVTVDAGAFVDATTQSDFAGIAADSWNFTTSAAADVTAPVISFTLPVSPAKGFGTAFPTITVTDDNAVSTVVVSIRKISGSAYTTLNATAGASNTYTVTLAEATHFDETGAEFFITATDASGNQKRDPAGTATHKLFLTYSESQSSIPSNRLGFGGEKSNWKVFSIPFDIPSPSNAINVIFDELAELSEVTDYKLLTLNNARTDWSEYPSFTTISRGQGYFINIKDVITIKLPDNLTAPANSRSDLFKINLAAGWNMIGNPYLTQISWDNVATLNSLSGDAAEILKYNGTSYSTGEQTLEPWEGAFVFSDAAVTDVDIPFLGQTAPGGRKGYKGLTPDISADEWMVKLNLLQGDHSYELGAIGMALDASAGYDSYDGVTPPRFFDYLEMNFAHPEHFAKRFTRDVVPTQKAYTWEFSVDASLVHETTLTWDNSAFSSSANDIFLLDVSRQVLVSMKESTSYSFNPKESRNFRVYFGENLRIAPEAVQLGKAYPNPTNGTTIVAFSLPEAGGMDQLVTLDLVDGMGRAVGTISQGRFNPGYHEVAFEAKELNAGFYAYRLTVQGKQGKISHVNKLVIK